MQTVRSVEIGLGAEVASTPGSLAHDEFALDGESVVRRSNRAGGIEGGMSNGEPILLRISVKPIPTLMKALPSVNLHEKTGAPETIVRSDVCVVPAAAIVGEAMVRLALVKPVWKSTAAIASRRRSIISPAARTQPQVCSARARSGRAVKRHVALVGFMAAGKLTIGRRLAGELGCAFYDTDVLIVRAHGTVATIFADEGEAAFRRYEREAIVQVLSNGEGSVVALGGGALTSAKNRALLAEHAHRAS